MKKKVLAGILSGIIITLTAISSYAYDDLSENMARIQLYYNQGYYYEMIDEINWARALSLSDSDIAILNDYERKAVYAASTYEFIYSELNTAQYYCNQGMYYEANGILDAIAYTYELTPLELEIWNAKKVDATAGINRWIQAVNNGTNYPENIRYVMQQLGVPFNRNITYFEYEPYYWEAGGRYLEYIEFFENGDFCACADVDISTFEIMRGIYPYQ